MRRARLHLPLSIDFAQGDGLDAPIALGAKHRGTRQNLDAGTTHRVRKSARQLWPDIGNGGDADAAGVQIQRGLIGGVAGGHDDDATPDRTP